ncbi:hypothetical protein [Flavobacterium beibuense]|uniref:hypothetical protein n=1 Tax=Flavobacterium beibuense TaxID=657326 RepID=UPI003A90DDDB
MASAVDLYLLEKSIGNNAAKQLRNAFRKAIRSTVNVKGESKKATVNARYKAKRLDRLTFSAPHYIFKLNYGFEGTKKNGVNMRLKATNVLNIALEDSGILEALANDISELRAEEIITALNFIRSGR